MKKRIEDEQLLGVRPLNQNLLVVPKRESEVTEGGVFLPEASLKVKNYGTVVAIAGKVSEEIGVVVGDTVLYLPYAGLEVTVGNRQYVSLSVEDLIAVLDSGDKK